MALQAKSLFLYGIQITEFNRHINFKAASGGPELTAQLSIGFYSLTSLLVEIRDAMESADLDNLYTVTADRTFSGGTENRITIATDGTFLSLLFATGSNSDSTPAELLGFTATDKTGSTTYTGAASCGTALVTPHPANDWISPTVFKKTSGQVNTTASGVREAIVYSVQRFWQLRVTWIPYSLVDEWADLMTWLTSQKAIDFTPEITNPETVYEGTLESTPADSNGLAFTLNEVGRGLGLYDTGVLKFRVKE